MIKISVTISICLKKTMEHVYFLIESCSAFDQQMLAVSGAFVWLVKPTLYPFQNHEKSVLHHVSSHIIGCLFIEFNWYKTGLEIKSSHQNMPCTPEFTNMT